MKKDSFKKKMKKRLFPAKGEAPMERLLHGKDKREFSESTVGFVYRLLPAKGELCVQI